MKNVRKLSGVTLATAAATLFLTTATMNTVMAEAHTAKVKCAGINGCKGQSACATATSACTSMNGCKGKGWIVVTAEECKAKGGKVIK